MAAVERYEVAHPVLDDPDLETWQQYAVRAWPTLVLIDPEGYVVAQHSGEGHAHAIDMLLEQLISDYQSRGTLHPDAAFTPDAPSPDTTLRFPAKAVLLPDRHPVGRGRRASLARAARPRRRFPHQAHRNRSARLSIGCRQDRASSANPTACACCPPTSASGWATTWLWRTP